MGGGFPDGAQVGKRREEVGGCRARVIAIVSTVLACIMAFGAVVACQDSPSPVVVERNVVQTVEVPVTVEVEATRQVEVTREVTREVEATRQVEVTREVPVTVEVEATRQVEVTREVTREVEATRQVEITREVPVTRQVEATRQVEVTREVEATRLVPVTRVVETTRVVEVQVTRAVQVTTVVVVTPTPDPDDLRRTPHRLCADYPYMIRVTELLEDFADASVRGLERGLASYFPDADVARGVWIVALSSAAALRSNHVAICGLQPIPPFYETREMTTPEGAGVCSTIRRGMFLMSFDQDVNQAAQVNAFLDVTDAYDRHCDNDFLE